MPRAPRLVGGKYGKKAAHKPVSDQCSEAMSRWKTTGIQTPEIAALLGKCRSIARKARSGKEPGAATTPAQRLKTRLEKTAKPEEISGTSQTPSKHIGEKVGISERQYADKIEQRVGKALKGRWDRDYKTYDVMVKREDGVPGFHAVEVKSKLKGEDNAISVHGDALLRKAEHAEANPGTIYHTVVLDHRHKFDAGNFKHLYSGHSYYYKRGSGRYALSQMHRVQDDAELKRLVHARDEDLPEKARGSLPEITPHLREKAATVAAARALRDTPEKKRERRQRSVQRKRDAIIEKSRMTAEKSRS